MRATASHAVARAMFFTALGCQCMTAQAENTGMETAAAAYPDAPAISVPSGRTAADNAHGEQRVRKPDPFISDGAIGHFTWGVDLASGVDLTARDMTMVNISGCFGYKGGIMRFAGVGAAIISMMNNSSRCYPVYAMARTTFSRTKKPCFLEVKAGVSFNSILDYKSTTDFYGSLGVGFTLAHSRKFSSHLLLSAVYMPLKSITTPDGNALGYTLAYASIGLGCAF